MKKIVIVLLVIAVTGSGFVVASKLQDKTTDTKEPVASVAETPKTEVKKACELLTLEDAKGLIGTNATLSEGSGAPNLATTENVKVDNCSYSADGATLADLKQLTIQIHSGDASQVKQAFDNYKKEYSGETLSELEGTAYYGTETKQVNVLKNNTWLFVSGGSINAGDAGNKELQIKAAQVILPKL